MTGRCHPWPNIFWMQTIEFNVRVSNMFYNWLKILIEIRSSNNQNKATIVEGHAIFKLFGIIELVFHIWEGHCYVSEDFKAKSTLIEHYK